MPRKTNSLSERVTFQASKQSASLELSNTDKKKKSLLPRLFIFLFLLPTLLLIGFIFLAYWYLSSFSQASKISIPELYSTFKTGLKTELQSDNNHTNFIILGLDEIVGQKDDSLLTDTIIVASYNHTDSSVSLLSLPRDLWVNSLKTKINALYYYGEISTDTNGIELTTSVINEITGLPIHYHIVLGLESLEQVINSIGGVNINVPQTFTDNKFPRSDVDIHQATDEAELYETITFEQGYQHMDGYTALKYIRSRQSQNPDEGTDVARSTRQQQLIRSVIGRIMQPDTIKNPHILGNLYYIYKNQLTTNFTDQDIISFARLNGAIIPTIETISIPIQQNGDQGLLYHPMIEKYNQWVYEPVDATWGDLNQFIADKFGL